MTAQEQLDLAAHIAGLVGDGAEATVRVATSDHGLTRFANSFIHQHVGERTTTASLTVAVEGRVASGSTSNLDADALERFVATTLAAARLQPEDPEWPGVAPAADVRDVDHLDPGTAAVEPAQRAALVRTFVDAAPDLRAAGYVDTETVHLGLVTTAGQALSTVTTRATLDGIHQTGASAGSAHQTSRRFEDLDAAAAGALAADRARRSASFDDLEPGTYEVVLGPECVATIVVFLTLYGFNGKAFNEGQSFVRLGEQQFDPAITLVDDAFDDRSLSTPFDLEGTPRARLPLIESGVTRNVAHDRRTAKVAGARSTGHSIGSPGYGAVPTSLVMAAGNDDPAALVSGVERGLLVTQFNYCRVLDPKTQAVTGLTRNGTFLIEDGEVRGAVGNLRFTQSFVEALAPGRVLGVGNDDRFADSEFGPGFAIAPSVRLAGWNFTGGARG